MLEETIRTIVKIQLKLHDLSVVLSTAARTDAGAAAAWRQGMDGQRSGIHTAFARLQLEGRLNPCWQLEQAVDVLAALLSTDSHHQLVVERGWHPDVVISKVWELCQATFVVEPEPLAAKRKRTAS